MNQEPEQSIPAKVDVTIQHVERNDKNAMRQVGGLHMELLSTWGPMTALGERFVREACYGVNMHDDLLLVDLLKIDDFPAGFVAYTAQSYSFHRNSLRAHWLRVVYELMLALLSRPVRIIGMFRALGVVASRRSEQDSKSGAMGEIVCIGVSPQYLSSKFVRTTGIRASELLINHAAQFMYKSGAQAMRMLVDKPNKAALFLYHKLGARFSEFNQAGKPMVEVVFDLEQALPEISAEIPDVWLNTEHAGKHAVSGWRRYWEQVSHNKEIFHYEAEDYFERFLKTIKTGTRERVLDFGCGYGFIAASFAKHGHIVSVWDASSNARKHAKNRLARYPDVKYADLGNDESCMRYKGQFDLITVHSVIQYITNAELAVWLKRWHMMLAANGRLLISDIITPEVSTFDELLSLIRLSWEKRFVFSAIWECLREAPNYWKTRNALSLNVSGHRKLGEIAAAAGFEVCILPENLSHRKSRLTAMLTRRTV